MAGLRPEDLDVDGVILDQILINHYIDEDGEDTVWLVTSDKLGVATALGMLSMATLQAYDRVSNPDDYEDDEY